MIKLSEEQEQRIVRAIANAERDNRGEVRVHLEEHCPTSDPVKRAHLLYDQLKMDQTQDDTAVLLYVASASKVAAVYSGKGIYGEGTDDFWQSVTDAVATGFRNNEPAEGMCNALSLIGNLLRHHAPGDDTAGNELPDELTTTSSERAS